MAGTSLAQKVYDALKGRILSNELVPGDMLNRRAVAREMGVSPMPVLEAMLQLESEGLLETLPRKGTRVRLVRPRDLRDQLVLREALECQAARQYCGEPIRANRKRLTEVAREVDRACQAPAMDVWQREIEFHRSLVELAECSALMEAFDAVMRKGLFFAVNALLPPHPGKKISSHVRLLKPLQDDDPEAAEVAMRDHLRTGKGEILTGVR